MEHGLLQAQAAAGIGPVVGELRAARATASHRAGTGREHAFSVRVPASRSAPGRPAAASWPLAMPRTRGYGARKGYWSDGARRAGALRCPGLTGNGHLG